MTAENSQLGAHLQLLQTELESARHGQTTDSAEASPRQSQLLPDSMPHGVTPSHVELPDMSGHVPSAVSAIVFTFPSLMSLYLHAYCIAWGGQGPF